MCSYGHMFLKNLQTYDILIAMGYHHYVLLLSFSPLSHFSPCHIFSCVGCLLKFVPHFPYLQNENNDSIYLPVLLRGLNIFIQEKCLEQSVSGMQ